MLLILKLSPVCLYVFCLKSKHCQSHHISNISSLSPSLAVRCKVRYVFRTINMKLRLLSDTCNALAVTGSTLLIDDVISICFKRIFPDLRRPLAFPQTVTSSPATSVSLSCRPTILMQKMLVILTCRDPDMNSCKSCFNFPLSWSLQGTCPRAELFLTFLCCGRFLYGEELLVFCPVTNVEDHPLPDVYLYARIPQNCFQCLVKNW
jgi:hypothetical protein